MTKKPTYKETLELKILESRVKIFADMEHLSRYGRRIVPLLIGAIVDMVQRDFGSGNPAQVAPKKVPEAIAAVPINRERFEKSPCYLCGYNGPGYFQVETHPCAEFYHKSGEDA